MEFDGFKARFPDAVPSGNGYRAKCPAHDDHNPSFTFWLDEKGKIAYKCHAGCPHEAVLSAMGLQERDLYTAAARAAAGAAKPAHGGEEKPERRIVAAYDYMTKEGKPIVRVVRYEPKGFGRMSPKQSGGWQWGKTSKAVALYRWPQLAEAVAQGGRTVFLVEGEKDADNMAKAGAAATTCLGGASKWQPVLAEEFKGAAIVLIIADRDGGKNRYEGQRFALAERRSIVAQGVKARAVCLPPEINGKAVKDASDALAAGWTLADIEKHCENADEVEAEFPQVAATAQAEAAPATGADGGGGEYGGAPGSMQAAIEAAIGKAVFEALQDKRNLSREDRRKTIVKAGIGWMHFNGSFYRDEEAQDDSGAFFFNRKKKELLRIKGNEFYHWIAHESHLEQISNDFKELLNACATEAMQGERSIRVRPSRFWDCRDDKIYISNGCGEMARITAQGCEIVDNGTDGVLFMRDRVCAPWRLLDESQGMPIWRLRLIGDIHTPEHPLAPLLLSLWVVTLPLNFKNKPPLSLCGEVGSGKTATAKGVFEILGLNERVTKVDKTDKGEDQFWVSVAYGGISTVDNVDSNFKWLPDAVASASTGGQQEKRKLYSDDELTFLKSRSAIIITSANSLYATDPGLADRLINITFTRPTDAERQSDDSALFAEIDANRDGLMTWLCWTLSKALGVSETPPAELNKRHPDWAKWCWRCGVALGLRDECEQVLMRAESDKALISVLSDSMIGNPLYRIMGELGCDWEGTAAQLCNLLKFGGADNGDCGFKAGTIISISKGAARPEEYDEKTKSMVSPHRMGKYLGRSHTALAKVFGMTKRKIHGIEKYRLSPHRQPGEDGGDEAKGFVKTLRDFFKRRREEADTTATGAATIDGGATDAQTTTDAPAEDTERPQNRAEAGGATDTPANATDAPQAALGLGNDTMRDEPQDRNELEESIRTANGYSQEWTLEDDEPFQP